MSEEFGRERRRGGGGEAAGKAAEKESDTDGNRELRRVSGESQDGCCGDNRYYRHLRVINACYITEYRGCNS